jgi:hypothetical protein
LSDRCFAYCRSLSTISFESGSQLSDVASDALDGCLALASICAPAALESVLGEYRALLKKTVAHGGGKGNEVRDDSGEMPRNE